ncbi:MAG: hypothetical protein ACKO8I_13910, partial [Cyanobacteriota bacterium]
PPSGLDFATCGSLPATQGQRRLEQQRHELTQLLGSSGYAAVSQCLQRFDFAAASASLAPIGLQEQNDPPAGPAPAWGDPAGSPDQPLPGTGCSPPIDP